MLTETPFCIFVFDVGQIDFDISAANRELDDKSPFQLQFRLSY